MIAVSHDRYFLKRIATRIVVVENGKLVDYQGDYEVGLRLGLGPPMCSPFCVCMRARAWGENCAPLSFVCVRACVRRNCMCVPPTHHAPTTATTTLTQTTPPPLHTHTPSRMPPPPSRQVFLEENEEEAEKMAVKEERAREQEKSNIKVRVGCGDRWVGGWVGRLVNLCPALVVGASLGEGKNKGARPARDATVGIGTVEGHLCARNPGPAPEPWPYAGGGREANRSLQSDSALPAQRAGSSPAARIGSHAVLPQAKSKMSKAEKAKEKKEKASPWHACFGGVRVRVRPNKTLAAVWPHCLI